jgi:undecaprenyl-diphosphatase
VEWDIVLFYALNGLAEQSGLVDGVILGLARPSNIFVPGLLACGYWLWHNRREAFIGMPSLALVVGAGDFVGAQAKHVVARPRPCNVLEHVQEVIGCGGTFSFPSNHAMNTAAAAAFLQMLYPATGWVSWPLVVIIGFSRVYLGGHYATDVFGGWLLGGIIGALSALLLLRWSKFRPPHPSRRVPQGESEAELQ